MTINEQIKISDDKIRLNKAHLDRQNAKISALSINMNT